jgi:hypothetical protein
MFKLAPIAVTVAALALLAACGDDGEEATLSPSPSPSASATASPSPTAEATQTPVLTASPGSVVPAEVAERRVVFLRDSEPYTEAGEIWISRLDGTERERLTRDGETAKFAGIATHYATGNETVYYVSVDGEFARSLWAYDRIAGMRSRVLSFESRSEHIADAAVSSDGRHVAYAHLEGIDMLDTSTGATKHLFDNGPRDCIGVSDCYMHSRPQWSPDGTLLMVKKTFWEGATTLILDPFADPVEVFTDASNLGPAISSWSIDGSAACAFGYYGEASGLVVSEAPAWEFVTVVPGQSADGGIAVFVGSCSWFDERLVAYGANIWRTGLNGSAPPPEISVQVRVFDRNTSLDRTVLEISGTSDTFSAEIIALPGTSLVVTQHRVQDAASGTISRPELINIETAARTWVLEEGDVLAGLVP